MKVGYIATADSSITVSAGGLTQQTSVSSGLHTLYFKAGDERFDSIRLGGLIGEATLCTNDVTVGRATVAAAIMSQPDRTFPTLNAVRGIGALMVLTTHAAFNTGQILRGWPGGALARLDFGVPLFFVLSGFLLSRPFFLAIGRGERHPSHRHYLWKRALRILPLYWVVVCVALLFDPANQGLGWQVWVRQLTLTQLYFPTLLPQSLTQMWSLCTEVAFYVADAADGVPPRGHATPAGSPPADGLGPGHGRRRARRGLAGVVRPHPWARGSLPAVAAGLDADVPGRDVLRGGQRRPDPAARATTCSTGWVVT